MGTNNYLKVGGKVVAFFDDTDEDEARAAVRHARECRSEMERTTKRRLPVIAFRGRCEPGRRLVGGLTVDGVVMVPMAVLGAEAAAA